MTRKFCVASARKSSRSPRPTFRDFFFVRCDGGTKKALPKKRAWVACAHNVAHSFFGEVQPSWLTKLVLFEAPLPPLVHFALLWLGELCVRGQLFASEPPTFVLLNSAQHDISLKSTLNSSVNLFFLASQVLFCSFLSIEKQSTVDPSADLCFVASQMWICVDLEKTTARKLRDWTNVDPRQNVHF